MNLPVVASYQRAPMSVRLVLGSVILSRNVRLSIQVAVVPRGSPHSCPQRLYELQTEARAEQTTKPWMAGYAARSRVEGTINEFVNAHGMRQVRYRSQDKAHIQNLLTAIAVHVERIDAFEPRLSDPCV
jgi:hypothetical protein